MNRGVNTAIEAELTSADEEVRRSRSSAIGRPVEPGASDAVDISRMTGTPLDGLAEDLAALVGRDQVLTRISDLIRYASDASPYRYLPQVVVLPRTIEDVAALLSVLRGHRAQRHLPGRRHQSGQSQSDDVLIDVRRHWGGLVVEDGGESLRARCGVILGHAQTVLRRQGRRLGPDPASSDVATIGGVIANNAAGMRCTIEHRSYHTVSAMTFVLPSGTVIDTAGGCPEAAFAAEPDLAAGLLARAELLADEPLAARVRRKFSIRNTTGYSLSALLDADTPLEIFRRLIVGSEEHPRIPRGSGIRHPAGAGHHHHHLAGAAVDHRSRAGRILVALGEAVDLMVAALIAAGYSVAGTPEYWKTLEPTSAALLVEFGAATTEELGKAEEQVAAAVAGSEPVASDRVRPRRGVHRTQLAGPGESLLGIVGLLRPEGAAVVNEDVCFPPDRIAEGATDLMALLAEHGFLPGVAGHAWASTAHGLTPKLSDPADRDRYGAFMSDLVELVIDKYDGSLKAEHGTGINMAPFVVHEWGEKATAMWRIKELADPHGVLGPNVVLTRDADVHLREFKSIPAIEVATRCIECGFCQAVPSARAATSPPRPASGSCCAGRWPANPRGHRCWPDCRPSTPTTVPRPAPWTACVRSRARCTSTPAR